jgi:hypothetical protein
MRRIALADFSSLAGLVRRSRALVALAVLAAVATAGLVVAAAPRSATPPDPLVGKGSSGIVVVDVSASISWDTYARIATTLDRLRRSNGRVGLVLFSDTAYQALPPETRAAELGGFERFFVVRRPTQPGFQPQPPRSPWTDQFSGGTRISTGLRLALDVIRREHLHHPKVVLVSDLDDDATDLESLTSVALAYRHLGVPIDVAALNPSPQDERYMRRLLPQGASIREVPLQTGAPAAPHAGVPGRLVAAAALLVLALAAVITLTQRIRWAT